MILNLVKIEEYHVLQILSKILLFHIIKLIKISTIQDDVYLNLVLSCHCFDKVSMSLLLSPLKNAEVHSHSIKFK